MDEVTMTDQYALRCSGGTRGIDDVGQVVGRGATHRIFAAIAFGRGSQVIYAYRRRCGIGKIVDCRAPADDDTGLAVKFGPVADALEDGESKIIAELNGAQGDPVDVGGYYRPDDELATRAMRPSATLNGIIDGIQ